MELVGLSGERIKLSQLLSVLPHPLYHVGRPPLMPAFLHWASKDRSTVEKH